MTAPATAPAAFLARSENGRHLGSFLAQSTPRDLKFSISGSDISKPSAPPNTLPSDPNLRSLRSLDSIRFLNSSKSSSLKVWGGGNSITTVPGSTSCGAKVDQRGTKRYTAAYM